MATATETNPVNKLLDLKVKEYDNLPGMILGLDGWILRTLPKDTREQFLQMYERALRVAFHPDRCFEEDKKRSREAYLQSVSEAVRYMLADDFAYEMISETVPARKNPMVTLRQSIEVRDNIISQLDDKLKEQSSSSASQSAEIAELRMKLVKQIEASKRATAIDWRLRMATRIMLRYYPVPCDIKRTAIVGSFLTPKPDREILDSFADYSSRNQFGEGSAWLKESEWIDIARQQEWLSDPVSFVFRDGKSEIKDKVYHVIIGAMTIVHLCECLRKINDFPAKPSPERTLKAIKYICGPIEDTDNYDEYGLKIKPFLLSHFNSDMLLLVEERRPLENRKTHRLIVVHSVSSQSNIKRDEVKGWREIVSKLNGKIIKLSKKLTEKKAKIAKPYVDRIADLKSRIKSQSVKIKQLKKTHEEEIRRAKLGKVTNPGTTSNGGEDHSIATAPVVGVRRNRDGLRQGTKSEHHPGRKKSQLKNV